MPKRNHHLLPKLYLKGFTESDASPFTWEYSVGHAYSPGEKHGRDNPCRRSINLAARQRDAYAYQNRDGRTDFEEFENKLEKLEKPADPIFRKIRNLERISDEEKATFASYLVLLDRRVPARDGRAEKLWPEVMESIGVEEVDPNNFALRKRREEIESILSELKSGPMPKEIKLQTMVSESTRAAPAMARMRWQFLVAPKGRAYLTCDNPVFYFLGYGIKPPFGEVSVPISSTVAIGMSWNMRLTEGYFPAKNRAVDEINRRSAFNAQKNIYMARRSRWTLDLLNKSEHKLGRLFGI